MLEVWKKKTEWVSWAETVKEKGAELEGTMNEELIKRRYTIWRRS
jgi:hypothetical protein